jgi:hypothetical protein
MSTKPWARRTEANPLRQQERTFRPGTSGGETQVLQGDFNQIPCDTTVGRAEGDVLPDPEPDRRTVCLLHVLSRPPPLLDRESERRLAATRHAEESAGDLAASAGIQRQAAADAGRVNRRTRTHVVVYRGSL